MVHNSFSKMQQQQQQQQQLQAADQAASSSAGTNLGGGSAPMDVGGITHGHTPSMKTQHSNGHGQGAKDMGDITKEQQRKRQDWLVTYGSNHGKGRTKGKNKSKQATNLWKKSVQHGCCVVKAQVQDTLEQEAD